MQHKASLILVAALLTGSTGLHAAQITAERSDGGVKVLIDGKLFTEYLVKSGSKPILWPILGPTEKPMTRAYPMVAKSKETSDHPHHRSFWFTHGSVNGIDFWSEGRGKGSIEHRKFQRIESGTEALIETSDDWLAPDGKKVCDDERRLKFGVDGKTRWIDFGITIFASEGPVKFGDTKEGTFGLRIADSIRVDAKKGGKIITSEGLTDSDAWGKRASWVDYHGPIGGETVGIAILNHPSSFDYPTPWHVRTYGLFAANPFGEQSFQGRNPKNVDAHVIPAGGKLTLRYRVLFHVGDEKEGKIAQAFAAYEKLDSP